MQIKKLERDIRELKQELAMHDTVLLLVLVLVNSNSNSILLLLDGGPLTSELRPLYCGTANKPKANHTAIYRGRSA